MKQRTNTPLEKLVLLILADCHNQSNGRCFPSISYLAEHAACSRKGAIKVIESLQEQGFISAKKAPGKSTFYAFHMEQTGELSTPVNTGYRCTEVTSTGELSSQTGELRLPEPGKNLEVNQERDARARFKKYPPEDFWPDPFIERQISGRFPNVDFERMVEAFKQIQFKEPDDWSRRFYQFALEQGTKFKRSTHDGRSALERKTDQLITGDI